MSKWLEKELEQLIAAKNNMWTASLGTFGGSFSLIFSNLPFIAKVILMTIGFTLCAGFLNKYLKKGDKIDLIIKVLRKRGD